MKIRHVNFSLLLEKLKFSSVHSHRKNNSTFYIIFDSLIVNDMQYIVITLSQSLSYIEPAGCTFSRNHSAIHANYSLQRNHSALQSMLVHQIFVKILQNGIKA